MLASSGLHMHYQSQAYIHSIEMVQRRAARFVMNKYSNYESVFQMLGWNTLEGRSNKLRAIMVYKIIHKIIDIQSHTYFIPIQLNTRGHHLRYQQLPTNVDS